MIGSAYLEYGSSKVCVYAFAPRPQSRNIDFDKGSLECEVHPAAHLVGLDIYGAKFHPEGSNGVLLRLARSTLDALTPAVRLSSYPKNVLMLTVLLLDSSSDDLVAIINASSLALCHAAIEMRDLVTAHSLRLKLNQLPGAETGANTTEVCCSVACLSNLGEISYVDFVGKSDPRSTLTLLDFLRGRCSQIRTQLAQVLVTG